MRAHARTHARTRTNTQNKNSRVGWRLNRPHTQPFWQRLSNHCSPKHFQVSSETVEIQSKAAFATVGENKKSSQLRAARPKNDPKTRLASKSMFTATQNMKTTRSMSTLHAGTTPCASSTYVRTIETRFERHIKQEYYSSSSVIIYLTLTSCWVPTEPHDPLHREALTRRQQHVWVLVKTHT